MEFDAKFQTLAVEIVGIWYQTLKLLYKSLPSIIWCQSGINSLTRTIKIGTVFEIDTGIVSEIKLILIKECNEKDIWSIAWSLSTPIFLEKPN